MSQGTQCPSQQTVSDEQSSNDCILGPVRFQTNLVKLSSDEISSGLRGLTEICFI